MSSLHCSSDARPSANGYTALLLVIGRTNPWKNRLEIIRRVAAPWQQTEIDRISRTVRLMAENAQDAIVFVNEHQTALWLPVYQKYAGNLYNEARTLTDSLDHALSYARAAKEFQQLRREMGARTSL